MGEGMKQVLVCMLCDEVVSDPIEVYDSSMEKCPDAIFDLYGSTISKPGFGFLSKISFVAAMELTDFASEKVQTDARNLLTLEKAATDWDETKFTNFPHLTFAPQHWLNPEAILDKNKASVKEGTGNWWPYCCGPLGDVESNTYCISCDSMIGTSCLECTIPNVFIPDPSKTKWRDAR